MTHGEVTFDFHTLERNEKVKAATRAVIHMSCKRCFPSVSVALCGAKRGKGTPLVPRHTRPTCPMCVELDEVHPCFKGDGHVLG